jgi:hypothetical protein
MKRLADLIAPVLLLVLCAMLFLPPAARVGLWYPWETAPAMLGQQLVQHAEALSPFAPLNEDGLIARPWLQTVLLKLGFLAGGGTEAGLRLPVALLTMACCLAIYGLLRMLYPPGRSALVAAGWVVTPAVFFGATHLAGNGWAQGPLTIALLLMAVMSARPGRWVRVLLPLLGVALAFSVWGMGLVGWAMPLTVLAAFAAGARGDRGSPASALGMRVVALVLVIPGLLLPCWLLWQSGGAELAQADTTASAAGRLALGWQASRHLAGGLMLGLLPPAALLAALPGSRAQWLLRPVPLGIAVAAFVLLVLPPATAVWQTAVLLEQPPLQATLRQLLSGGLFSTPSFPAHLTFDVVIRIVGFTTYPLVVLAPLGFGYLLHPAEPDREGGSAPADLGLRLFLGLWLAVGFAVFGLAASLAHHYAFVVTLPLVMAGLLALTDPPYMERFRTHRGTFLMAGIGALAVLAVLSKDIRGHLDTEAGQAGPSVLFEILLADGTHPFPTDYTLQRINVFVLSWVLLLLMYFGQPLESGRALAAWSGDRLAAWEAAPLRRLGWLRGLLRRLGGLSLRAQTALEKVQRRLAPTWLGAGRSGTLVCWLFVASVAVWTFHLAAVDVPGLSDHFSRRDVVQTWSTMRTSEPLQVSGIERDDLSWYLHRPGVTDLGSLDGLRTRMCSAEDGARTFLLVPMDRVSEAWFQAMRTRGAAQDEACPPRPLFMHYGRGSRHALLSDRLDAAAGERHEGVLARNVYLSEDELPAGISRPAADEEPTRAGEYLELVGWSVTPSLTGRGMVEIAAWWKVLQTPPSGYRSFIHVDYRGNRINGDHDLVEGLFPMQHWIPGTIMRDAHEVRVSRTDRSGTYAVYYGFFRGDDRLTATGPRTASENRFLLGELQVQR